MRSGSKGQTKPWKFLGICLFVTLVHQTKPNLGRGPHAPEMVLWGTLPRDFFAFPSLLSAHPTLSNRTLDACLGIWASQALPVSGRCLLCRSSPFPAFLVYFFTLTPFSLKIQI